MKVNKLIFLVLVIIVIILVVISGNKYKEKSSKAGEEMRQAETEHFHSDVLPTITKAKIAVQNAKGEDLGSFDFEEGKKVQIPNSKYSLQLSDFYTHWNWDGHPINLSNVENNPAVKVVVYANNDSIYYGWAFKNAPFFKMSSMDQSMEKDGTFAFALISYEGFKPAGK